MRRAVFLDRDGTICEDVGYLGDPAGLRVYDFAGRAIRRLNDAGLLTILVTNQSGVARGYFDEDAVAAVHERLVSVLSSCGARLDAIYYCPHHPTAGRPPYRIDCGCRKPLPGMIERAASDHYIDVEGSWVVGDKRADVLLAQSAGARAVLVRTGYGSGEWEYHRGTWPRDPEHVAENLADAVEWILTDALEGAE